MVVGPVVSPRRTLAGKRRALRPSSFRALRENDRPYLASFELFNKIARAVTNNSNQKPQFGTVLEAGDEGFGDFTCVLKN